MEGQCSGLLYERRRYRPAKGGAFRYGPASGSVLAPSALVADAVAETAGRVHQGAAEVQRQHGLLRRDGLRSLLRRLSAWAVH